MYATRGAARESRIPKHIIIYSQANPLTDLQQADYQALYFSARQEEHNLSQYLAWCKFITASQGKYFQCSKRLSDSPGLTSAVAEEQAMVVQHQIRYASDTFKLLIPKTIDHIVICYYKQKAIYPVPIRINGPISWTRATNRRTQIYGPLSWKIDDGESMKDIAHPLNQKDRARYEEAMTVSEPEHIMQTTIIKEGQWKSRIHWHKWHC